MRRQGGEVARRRHVGLAIERAAHAGLDRARRVDEPLLGGALEDRAVEVLDAVVGVPDVGVRVEVGERQRAVNGGRRAQLGEDDGVVAAQAERDDAGGMDRSQERLDALERLDVVTGQVGASPKSTIDRCSTTSTRSRGLYGRRRTEALPIASGPKWAPERKETALSVGMPMIAASASARSSTCGRRMKVRTPVKRGIFDESAGRSWIRPVLR